MIDIEPIPTSIRVQRLGAADLRPTKTPAVHAYDTLVVHVGGSVRVEHHGDFELVPGHVHLIPAGDLHRTLVVARPDVWGVGFCRTCLDQDRFRELLAPLDRVRQGAAPFVELPAERQAHVLDLLRELTREQHSPTPLPVVTESLLALLLAEVVRAAGPDPAPPRSPPSLVAAALAVIEARCLGPLTLTDVAEAVHRSPAHLTTAVKRATGRTVGAWIIEARLAEARRRLLATDELVDVIADRIGYADATHFVRLFRRRHGVTPAAYRRRARP